MRVKITWVEFERDVLDVGFGFLPNELLSIFSEAIIFRQAKPEQSWSSNNPWMYTNIPIAKDTDSFKTFFLCRAISELETYANDFNDYSSLPKSLMPVGMSVEYPTALTVDSPKKMFTMAMSFS